MSEICEHLLAIAKLAVELGLSVYPDFDPDQWVCQKCNYTAWMTELIEKVKEEKRLKK